jgi:16S rRNA (cytosine967-C5)-methyltransferase
MTAPARTAALSALRAIERGRGSLPAELARAHAGLADERDRALATTIVTGTLRWQRACDHLIAHFAQRPLDRLDIAVCLILRLSLYQLLHLDRVPASAVVDDAVTLTRAAGLRSATGFVNAVLRSTLRQRHRLPFPPRPVDTSDRNAAARYLGVTCSHPDWLVSRWLDRYGFEHTEQWTAFNNSPAPVTLSVNRIRATRDDVRARLSADEVVTAPTRFAPVGLTVLEGDALQYASDGRFFAQDEASQLVALAVDGKPGERTLDLCASPGGKTVNMAGDMDDEGVIVACDARVPRVALLRETLRRAGTHHAHVAHVADTGPLPFAGGFDRVLVDAPCSGLGTVRREPDIKWRRHESDLADLASRQLALLERAADVVRPGGRLVYATCSSEPEENERVVERFLARHGGFHPVDLRATGPQALAALLDDRGMLRTLPFTHGLEAFYAAALRRAP